MDNLIEKKLQLLVKVATFYKEDTNRRCKIEIGKESFGAYKSPTGQKDPISRVLPDFVTNMMAFNDPVAVGVSMMDEEHKMLGVLFWRKLQELHDIDEHWKEGDSL